MFANEVGNIKKYYKYWNVCREGLFIIKSANLTQFSVFIQYYIWK